MISMHHILYSLVFCLLIQKVFPQEIPEFAEEYIDEDLPESSADIETAPVDKPNNSSKDKDLAHKKTNFTEDRFTKLFGSRRPPPKASPFLPKFMVKAKPTLPSFIKNTQPILRVQPTTSSPQQQSRFNQRSVTSTQRTTTTRTPSRLSNANNRRNQNNNNRSNTQTTASPTSTTDSSARRRFGSGNRRIINSNTTIPATSRPNRQRF